MTSEIRANTLKNRVGLGTVSFTNTGPVVSGIVTANTLRLPDATSGSLGRLQLGNGLHFSMYHDGNNSFLVNNNGYLSIQSQAGVNGIFIQRNAEVNLYYGPSVRLQTSSVGVTINRDLDVDGHTNLDNVSIAGVTTITGSGNALEIVGGLVRSRNTASARFVANNGSAEGYFGWSSGVLTVGQAAATLSLEATGSNHIQLKTNGDERLRITSAGLVGIGTATVRNNRAMQFTGESNSIFLMTGHAPSICLNRDPDDSSDGDRSFFGVSSVSNGFANGTAAGDTIIRGNSSGKLHFATSTSIRMSIASSGDTTLYGSNVSLAIGTLYIPDSLVHNGDNDTKIRFPSNDNISFETGGSERLRVSNSLVTVQNSTLVASKITNSSSYTSHNANFYGGDVNSGGVRIELAHSTTTVSGNTASGAFPHNLLLSNYSGSGSADNRMVSIGFDIPTTSSHANATIAYQATGSNGVGDLQFWLENGNTSYERLRITSDGNVLCGGTAVSQTNRQLVVGSNSEANLAIETHNTSASETANIRFYRSRGTAASPTTLVDNDVISNLLFYGHDGTDYAHAAAMIRVECDGTVAGNQMPGAMSFHTNVGSTSATERLRITSDGKMGLNHTTPPAQFVVRAPGGSGHCSSQVHSGDSSTIMNMMVVQGGEGRFGMNTNHNLAIYTNGLEKLHLSKTGSLFLKSLDAVPINQAESGHYSSTGYNAGHALGLMVKRSICVSDADTKGVGGIFLSHTRNVTCDGSTYNMITLHNREGTFVGDVYVGFAAGGAGVVRHYKFTCLYAANTLTSIDNASRAGKSESISVNISTSNDAHFFQVIPNMSTNEVHRVSMTIVGAACGRNDGAGGDYYTVNYN